MNRETKFRAWSPKYEQMVLLEKTTGHYDFEDGYCVLSFVVDGYSEFGAHERYGDSDSSVVFMQYTGLKDKNGKDIYLDDLYKDQDGDVFKVIQMDCGRFALKMVSNNYIDEFVDWDCIEVIGNIYENPELLSQDVK